jgi:hypothetical protein
MLKTYSFDRSSLLFGDADGLSSRWEWRIVVTIFAQELEKLLWVLPNELSQLWVASADLLEDRLKHLGLLLDDLSELLELWVISQEVEVTQTTSSGSSPSTSSSSPK